MSTAHAEIMPFAMTSARVAWESYGELPEMGLIILIAIATKLLLQTSSLPVRDLLLELREAKFDHDDIIRRPHFVYEQRRISPKNVSIPTTKLLDLSARMHITS
jgi:hypothetical protein